MRHDFAVSVWSHLIFWFHAICTTADYFACFLVNLSVAYGGGVPLAELDHLFRCAHSPMKLGALHSLFCDGFMDDFHWSANLPERHYRMPPLLGGYLVQ